MGGIQQTLDAWLCIDPHCSSSNFTTAHSPRISHLRPTPSLSSTTTGSHPRTRSWKAYWTRSSSRTTDPEAHIKKKRRKMEVTEGDDTATWPSECENKFVQLLVELVNTGRIVNVSVHTNLWSPIASQLSDQTGRTYTAKQCRTKYTRLRMNHREFSDLLNHRTGLGWDPISNTVQGTESQWQSYLRINRKAGRFREKGCQNYEMLGLIFNGSTATGVLRHSFARTPPDSEEEEELNNAQLRFGMHVNAGGNMGDVVGISEGAPVNGLGCVNGGDDGSVSMGGPQSHQYSGVVIGGRQHGKRQVDYCGPSSDSKRKGKGKGKESSESMDSLRSEALKEFVEVHRMKKEMMRAAQQNLSSGEGSAGVGGSGASFAIANSMSRALNILDDLAPNLDDQTYLRAFEQLREETIRDSFIAMPPSRRKAWLATL